MLVPPNGNETDAGRLEVGPGGDTVEVRLTVPVNPFLLAIVTVVDDSHVPCATATLEGLALIVKSAGGTALTVIVNAVA